jgi:LPXTG-motif cell wall-anchored protein
MHRSDRRRSKIRQRRTRRGIGAAVACVALVGLVLGGLLPAGAEESEPVVDEPTTTTSTTLAEPPIETSTEPPAADTPLVAAAEVTPPAGDQQVIALAETINLNQTPPISAGESSCLPDGANDIQDIPEGQMIWHFVLTNAESVNGIDSESDAGYPADMISALTLDFGADSFTVVQTKITGIFHWWVQTDEDATLAAASVTNVVPKPNGNTVLNLSHCEFGDGSLTVDKVVVGTPAGDPTFTINVECDTDPAIDVDLTFDASGNLDPDTQDATFDDLPWGTECTVEEVSPPADAQVTYTLDGAPVVAPATFTVTGSGHEFAVEVTNTFGEAATGSISVEKAIDDEFGDPTLGDEYDVQVVCFDGDTEVFDQTVTLTYDSKMSHTFTGIPIPSSCTVTEVSLPVTATLVSYSPHGDDPDDPTTPPVIDLDGEIDTASVTITNAYSDVGGEFTGSVDVAKRVLGGPPAEGTEFVINIRCIGVTVDIDQNITLRYSDKLTDSLSFNAPSVETVTCTVKEVSPLGGAVKASVSPNGGVVVLTVSAPAADVEVTNDYGDPEVQVGGTSVQSLPFTGSTANVLVTTAAVLLAAGTALWFVTRRRRSASRLA